MASYTLAAFTLAALLALTILALSDANERADIALFGLAVPAVFWTVPPVVLRLTGYSASETVFFIALATAGFGSCWPGISYAKRSHKSSTQAINRTNPPAICLNIR